MLLVRTIERQRRNFILACDNVRGFYAGISFSAEGAASESCERTGSGAHLDQDLLAAGRALDALSPLTGICYLVPWCDAQAKNEQRHWR
jgi:hypothetical protein